MRQDEEAFYRLGQYTSLISLFGGKYVIGIATAGSFGAAKAAGQLAASISDGVFRRAYVSGALGVHLRGQRVCALPKELRKARALGRKMASDIRGGRLPNALFLRPLSGVYEELLRSGIVKWGRRPLPHLR